MRQDTRITSLPSTPHEWGGFTPHPILGRDQFLGTDIQTSGRK